MRNLTTVDYVQLIGTAFAILAYAAFLGRYLLARRPKDFVLELIMLVTILPALALLGWQVGIGCAAAFKQSYHVWTDIGLTLPMAIFILAYAPIPLPRHLTGRSRPR